MLLHFQRAERQEKVLICTFLGRKGRGGHWGKLTDKECVAGRTTCVSEGRDARVCLRGCWRRAAILQRGNRGSNLHLQVCLWIKGRIPRRGTCPMDIIPCKPMYFGRNSTCMAAASSPLWVIMALLKHQLLFRLFTPIWVLVVLFLNRITYTDPKLLEAAISSSTFVSGGCFWSLRPQLLWGW